MIRTLIYLLLSIFLITLVRIFIGIISKGLGEYLNPSPRGEHKQAGSGKSSSTGAPRSAGTLRKDSLTGIYVAEEIAIAKVINGETHYFASEDNFRTFLKQTEAATSGRQA